MADLSDNHLSNLLTQVKPLEKHHGAPLGDVSVSAEVIVKLVEELQRRRAEAAQRQGRKRAEDGILSVQAGDPADGEGLWDWRISTPSLPEHYPLHPFNDITSIFKRFGLPLKDGDRFFVNIERMD